MSVVSISTILSVLIFCWVVPYEEYLQTNAANALGLVSHHTVRSLVVTSVLMTIFYLGPLLTWLQYILISRTSTVLPTGKLVPRTNAPSFIGYVATEVVPGVLTHFTSTFAGSQLNTWINLRALVFAPVTEEIVFRSVMVPALHIAFVSAPKTILQMTSMVGLVYSNTGEVYSEWMVVWMNPLCFGVAHVHHLIEKINSGMRPMNAIIQTLVMFTYTSIFGVIATLLYMRTGNVYSAILSHVICNSVGLPDISFLTNSSSHQGAHYSCLYDYRYVHLVMHALGLIVFACVILPLTAKTAQDSVFWKAS